MPLTLVDPRNETARNAAQPAPRLESLAGKTVALLDISKPGGSIFLDRLELLLKERHGVAHVERAMKPTFAKPAPDAMIEKLRSVHAVVEGLAD
jgi:hypothetical protein